MSILEVKNISKIYTTRFGSAKVYGRVRLRENNAAKYSGIA